MRTWDDSFGAERRRVTFGVQASVCRLGPGTLMRAGRQAFIRRPDRPAKDERAKGEVLCSGPRSEWCQAYTGGSAGIGLACRPNRCRRPTGKGPGWSATGSAGDAHLVDLASTRQQDHREHDQDITY
jgi:hypothetical protein